MPFFTNPEQGAFFLIPLVGLFPYHTGIAKVVYFRYLSSCAVNNDQTLKGYDLRYESVLYTATLAIIFFFRGGGINDVESEASLGGICIGNFLYRLLEYIKNTNTAHEPHK